MSNRINLLNPSASQQARTGSEGPNRRLVIVCVALIIAAVAAYAIILGLGLSASKAPGDTAAPASSQAEGVTALMAERAQTESNVKKLSAERPRLSAYLDELLKTLPASMALTSLDIKDKPLEVTIKGVSASQLFVAQFARNLQDSEHFRDIILSASEKRVKENLFEYVITITPDRKGGVSSASFINR